MSVLLPKLENDIMAYLNSDEELCMGYKGLTAFLGVSRPYLEPAIKHLKELGYLEFWKGLTTDDGEVAGSGWCRSRLGNQYVEEHDL